MVMWGQSRVAGWDWGDRSEATRPTVHACIHTKITRARKKQRETHRVPLKGSRSLSVRRCPPENRQQKKKQPVETQTGFTLLALVVKAKKNTWR